MSDISESFHYILLSFRMKLEQHKYINVTYNLCYWKFLFFPEFGILRDFLRQILTFCLYISGCFHYIFLIFLHETTAALMHKCDLELMLLKNSCSSRMLDITGSFHFTVLIFCSWAFINAQKWKMTRYFLKILIWSKSGILVHFKSKNLRSPNTWRSVLFIFFWFFCMKVRYS